MKIKKLLVFALIISTLLVLSSCRSDAHDFEEWRTVEEATCEKEGIIERACNHCELVETETTPKSAHRYGEEQVIPRTCTEPGRVERECELCHYVHSQVIDKERGHSLSDWHSEDNVTMHKDCAWCEYSEESPIPETVHELSLSIGDRTSFGEADEFVCDKCGVFFALDDVLTYTVTNSEIDEKYALRIDSKISSVTFTSIGLTRFAPGLTVNCEGFVKGEDWSVTALSFSELTIGDNISFVEELFHYEIIKKLTFSADVTGLGERCIENCISLKEIYFLGDLPSLSTDSLYTVNSARHDNFKEFEPTVFYNGGAKGFSDYQYKIQGCTLKEVGSPEITYPDISLTEYSKLSAKDGLDIAKILFERYEGAGTLSHTMPYTNIDSYKEIKDFAISLTQGLNTEREKAEAIFEWIVSNIRYDESARYYSVERVFDEKIAVCNGYAILMRDMLYAVGISSLYTHGITYAESLTVDQIVKTNHADLCDILYPGSGHAWLTVMADGEVFLCDPTWGEFDISAEELSKTRITLGVMGINAIPESFDPRAYEFAVHLDTDRLFILENGKLSAVDMHITIYNYSFEIMYRIYSPNDGYGLTPEDWEIRTSYSDKVIEYSDMGYEFTDVVTADFSTVNYVKYLRFVFFENVYYGKDLTLAGLENFIVDENGIIYLVKENGELSVMCTISQSEELTVSALVNGKRVTSIEPNAFYGSKATKIILPDSITYISAAAFSGCEYLTEITLPSSLETMEVGIFGGCLSLRAVYISNSLKTVGLPDNHRAYTLSLIFDGCSEQLKVYYDGTEEEFNNIHFNNPYLTEDFYAFDTEQYEHFKSYVVYQK